MLPDMELEGVLIEPVDGVDDASGVGVVVGGVAVGAAAPGVVVSWAPAPVEAAAIMAATAPTMIQFRFMGYSLG